MLNPPNPGVLAAKRPPHLSRSATFIPPFSLGVVPTPNFRIYNHSLNEMSISRVPVRGPSEIAPSECEVRDT